MTKGAGNVLTNVTNGLISTVLNVYYYSFFDEEACKACSGLVAAANSAEVREEIEYNFGAFRHLTVRRVPELCGIERGDETVIVKRPPKDMDEMLISCATCRKNDGCPRDNMFDGLECCNAWEAIRDE